MREETILRRVDFQDGAPIRFADGRERAMPGPPPAGSPLGDLESEYLACVAAVRDAEDDVERLQAELALTILLLDRTYELGPADYEALLALPSGSPELAALQRDLRGLARAHVRFLGPRRC